MVNAFLVGVGGFFGAIARYQLSGWILHHTLETKFPWSTFAVNVMGCFVIGALAGLTEKFGILDAAGRLFLVTGFLGGFTTFSAFGMETFYLLRRGEMGIAIAYAAGSTLLGLAALWSAWKLIELLSR